MIVRKRPVNYDLVNSNRKQKEVQYFFQTMRDKYLLSDTIYINALSLWHSFFIFVLKLKNIGNNSALTFRIWWVSIYQKRYFNLDTIEKEI